MKKKRHSISVQLFIGIFCLSLMIILIIGVALFNFYRDILEEKEIQYHLEVSNHTREQFNVLIDTIDDSSYSLVTKAEVKKAVTAETNQGLSAEEREELSAYIKVIASIHSSINNVHIFGLNGFCISSNPVFEIPKNNAYYRNHLNQFLLNNSRSSIWTEFHSNEKDNYLSNTSYIRPVFDSDSKKLYGIIVLDISYESIHKLFTISSIRLKDKAVIVNNQGTILFQYPLQTDYKHVLREYSEVIGKSTQIQGVLNRQKVIIVSEKIPVADWSIIRFVQKDEATQMVQDAMKLLYRLLILVICICFAYAVWMTCRIIQPLKDLMNVCTEVSKGNFNAHIKVAQEDEFGELGITFNRMLEKINDSFEKEKMAQKRKAEMEYQILQAQINPHFLYNTLDSIKWLAMMQGVDNIAEMSTALINLLKYNLGKTNEHTCLHDEVESVKNYCMIQKYRYNNVFKLTTDIDEQLEQCRILRFILQPLVENSIIHGFAEDRENYRVHISAKTYHDQLHIKVIDNGTGMDKDRTVLLNSTEMKGTRFNKIGVNNVRERLKLHYGEQASLFFESEPHIATIAQIIIPLTIDELTAPDTLQHTE